MGRDSWQLCFLSAQIFCNINSKCHSGAMLALQQMCRAEHNERQLCVQKLAAGKPSSRDALSGNKLVPHQLGALTFYRYEQPIVDYCQAHQPLRLNMGYDGPPQSLEGLEDLGPCDRGTIQTIALPAVPPGASIAAVPGPRSPPPPLRPPTEGPSGGSFPPTERTGTLKFGR
ncbi:unnamed protein product [Tetraodon nigroviridis]|uniref:(spotted green pufferfish) hypothetical protein n=1 Tax=Tetraodon nigroviridis TaxID=99883 RepID=Q4SE93_TETNG|nr:unnamed protein product [Tetraodon nigroviridis]